MNDSLKNGLRPIQIPTKSFKPNEFIFKEGELGSELYIIQSGVVSVQTGSGAEAKEVTQLTKGAILGEMSLLDKLPRSASAQALQTSSVTIINQTTFAKMAKLLPLWLNAIIKIVVSRIREANKRIDQPLVKDSLLSLVMFLSRVYYDKISQEASKSEKVKVPFFEALNEYSYLTRISKSQFETDLNQLVSKQMLNFIRDDNGDKLILIHDGELLDIYSEFWISQNENKAFPLFELDSSYLSIMDFLKENYNPDRGVIIKVKKKNLENKLKEYNSRLNIDRFDKLFLLKILHLDETDIEINLPNLKRALKTIEFQAQISSGAS